MEEASPQTKTLDIFPIGKGKRILLWLADFFIYFILATFLFTVGAFPAGRAIVHYEDLQKRTNDNTSSAYRLLVNQKLLYPVLQESEDFAAGVANTQKLFLAASLQAKLDSNPFYTFYDGTLGRSLEDLGALYQTYDAKNFYSASKDAVGLYALKDTYQKEWAPLLDSKDNLAGQALTDYNTFTTSFFLPFYNHMISDLSSGEGLASDSPLLAYGAYIKDNHSIAQTLDLTLIISAYASFLFTGAILYILVPCVSKKGKTLGMMALRVVRVGSDNLAPLKRGERALSSVYFFLESVAFIPFLPLAYIGSVSNLFSIPAFIGVAFASLGVDIVSLILLLTSGYNKDLSDLASRSVIIDDESSDSVERVRSYGPRS
jgi:hypothetical protein